MRIDDVDEAIISAFEQDGRQSNREVARKLDVSEGTVRQRLKKLQDAHAIQFDVVTDATQMGITYVAFVRMSVAPARLGAVLDACCEIPELWYVAATAGRFDVICLICVESAQDAERVIHSRIRNLEGIDHIDVRQVIQSVRHDFREVIVPRD